MHYYGIPAKIIRFYKAFYSNMRTVYEVLGHLTSRIKLIQGDPQASYTLPPRVVHY